MARHSRRGQVAGKRADIGDPSGDAVDRFLKWESDPTRRSIAVAAALPRIFNQDVLAVIAPGGKVRELFDWLRGLPFVSQRGQAWVYHDVVRAAMLRLRQAETPAEWRSEQNLLAKTNAKWASEASDGVENTWTDPDWIDHTREETYHLLCADPRSSLPKALVSAVKAAEHSPTRARQWAILIADAGRDTRNAQFQNWGQRLTASIRGDDLSLYFTCLINDAQLDATVLVIAYEQRGEAYRLSERYDDALADFNRAIELEPVNAWAVGSRGQAYRAMERYDDALADFNRAIELNPSNDWAIAHRGQAYREMGRYDDALADFNRAIELDPSDEEYAVMQAAFCQMMGRGEDARLDLPGLEPPAEG